MVRLNANINDPQTEALEVIEPYDGSEDLIQATSDCIAELEKLIEIIRVYKIMKYEKLYLAATKQAEKRVENGLEAI